MAKKKAAPPPDGGGRATTVAVRSSMPWKDWLDRLAEFGAA